MGMKLKSGADLCGFQLTNFCVQGEASAPSDAALGRKYFHTNATDDVATGISLLNRERIYLGEGVWRATAYLDDIAAINEKLNLITGDTDTDTLINNLKDLEEFLKDFSETDKLKRLLDGKLDKSGGKLESIATDVLTLNSMSSSGAGVYLRMEHNGVKIGEFGCGWGNGTYMLNGRNHLAVKDDGNPYYNNYPLIHSGNIGSYKAGGLAHSNGTIGAVVNSSGNVTIGASDLASTNYKFFVNGSLLATTTRTQELRLGESVNGSSTADNKWYYASIGYEYEDTTPQQTRKPAITFKTMYNTYAEDTGVERMRITSIGNVLIGTPNEIKSGAKLQVKGDLYVDGNIIATKEVSAGGAGAEGGTSGSGSAEGVSEIFTPTSTSMAFDHNLGEDVIVQVYEKSGNVWNMVMVDTEITSATKVTLRFGKTETTQHKVVIMGV